MMTQPRPTDDGALASLAREGSLDALGELYRRHAQAVLAVAFRITASEDDAQDVLQDVFVGLPRALARYSERGTFAAWLKQVAARTSLMRLRGQRRRDEQVQTLTHTTPVVAAADASLSRLEVRRALQALPDAYRTVFALKEIEGYSHDDIADMLGITAGASATRLSRAWRLLRKELT